MNGNARLLLVVLSIMLSAGATLHFLVTQDNERWGWTTSSPFDNAKVVVVDPEFILGRFIELRALELEGESFNSAVRALDDLVSIEARKVTDEFGVVVVRSDFVLSGGIDYSDTFLNRVILAWDQSNGS